ncbi:MAG: hypothetical protein R8K22_06725 [Mariprofundaceae bacterium]
MKIKSLLIAVVLLLGITPAMAGDIAVGAKVSTLGLGIEATTNVIPMVLNARVLVSGFNYSRDITDTSVTYNAKLKLLSVGAIADWYPLAGKFRVSGGLFYNGNKFTMNAKNTGNVVIGGTTYTSPTVTGEIKFNSFAPYLGLGYGDAISSGSPLGFNIEVGALYQGAPKSSITAPAVSAADIAAEKKKLDDSLNSFKFYPVIALGMTYKF